MMFPKPKLPVPVFCDTGKESLKGFLHHVLDCAECQVELLKMWDKLPFLSMLVSQDAALEALKGLNHESVSSLFERSDNGKGS